MPCRFSGTGPSRGFSRETRDSARVSKLTNALPLQRYVPSRGFSREPERSNALSHRLLGNALPITPYSATLYTEL